MKATVYSTSTVEERQEAIKAAQQVLRDKKTLVIPTDTVYGIAADAFSPDGVAALLAAKGRSRTMPPPVLIFDEAVLPGLADQVSADATALARKFWPGALTLILYSQPSLQWDLGETQGTVALRVPNDPFTIDLLRQTGPLAVSSANKTGRTAATTAESAGEQLGEEVEIIIDGGERPLPSAYGKLANGNQPSTIVDCTSDRLIVVREGAISLEELREVVPTIVTKDELERQNRESSLRRLDESHQSVATANSNNSEQHGSVAVSDTFTDQGADNDSAGAALSQDHEEVELAQKASSPDANSFTADLVGGATGSHTGIDQKRTKAAHKVDQHKQVRESDKTNPVSVEEAKSLVFNEN